MNTIYNEIAEEFGSSALSINHAQPSISIVEAAKLYDALSDSEKEALYAKRWGARKGLSSL